MSIPGAGEDATEVFYSFDPQTNTENLLLRYPLAVPSMGFGSDYPVLPTSVIYQTPFTGYLWLSAGVAYDLSDPWHNFTLYTDKVSPVPSDFWNSGSSIQLALNSAGLLAGRGWTISQLCDTSLGIPCDIHWGPGTHGGSLDVSGNFFSCLAGGCGTDAELQLAGLRYVDDGQGTANIDFVANDPRTLVYREAIYFDTTGYRGCDTPDCGSYIFEHSYYLQAVPIPPSLWLLASGLLTIIGVARGRRAPAEVSNIYLRSTL